MPFLSKATAIDPGGFAVEDGEGRWSFSELSRVAEGVAARLLALGVGRGEVVGLVGVLDRGLLSALHGIWKAGGIAAPFNVRWTLDEARMALGTLKPRLLLLGEEGGKGFGSSSLTDGLECYRLASTGDSRQPALLDVEASPRPLSGLLEGDEAVRLLTSGTSGRPRSVGLSVGNLTASAHGAMERLDLRPTDRWLGSLSPAHVGGVALVTRAGLVGSGVVLAGPFSAAGFLSLAEAGALTHASLVPTMLHRVLERWQGGRAPESLRCLLVGGAPARKELVQAALARGFPIALTYGLTEACSQVATAPPSLVREKPGTVGLPIPGVRVGFGDGGELLVQGPTVASGQMNPDGWLRTGDLARMDAAGHLWITGRRGDLIITGGVNVDPAAVERVLETHPDVEEAVVVGIPDPEWGERVVAAVACASHRPGLMGQLNDLAKATLSPASRPRSIQILRALPRNANGKVDRKRVRALFQ